MLTFEDDVPTPAMSVHAATPETIRAQFDLGHHLKHVDTIFKRVFGA